MANNQKIKTKSYISEDWYGGYKLELNLTSESNLKNWTLDFELPYNISAAYGVDLIKNSNGSYTITGQDGWADLNKGQSIKPIFIVEDNGKKAKVPDFTLQDAPISTPSEDTTVSKPQAVSETSQTGDRIIKTNALVTEDWNGGYKLEVDLTGGSNNKVKNWTMDFDLPSYNVRDAYGVNLIDRGNGSYSFSGQGGWQNLSKGETAKAVFIIDDNGKDAKVPQFKLQGTQISTVTETEIEPEKTQNTSNSSVLSSNAIKVGFEAHASNTVYGEHAQRKDWNVNFSSQDMEKYAVVSDREAYSGSKSLKVTYPNDTQINAGAGWKIPDAKEYYLSYQVKFAENFDFNGKYDWSSGGKLPGLGAGGLCSGGMDCDGTNGFTSRPMWREDGRAVLYLYHMDKPGEYGEDVLLRGSDGKENFFKPGKWHNITQRVRINDGNQSNGELDVWMDDERVLSRDNLQFVNNGQEIDTMFFNTFHGGYGSDWWPDNDVNAYFDDFIISTNAGDVGL